jgi:hemerythrin-like metal-binding protein
MQNGLSVWSAEFENGVIWQDMQHRELVQSINKLYKAIASNQPEEVIQKIVAFLHDYTMNHFDMEEKYMEEFQYPETLAHAQQHKDFVRMLEIFEKERKHSKTLANLSLCFDLNEWTLSHIKNEDQKFARFLQETGGA